MQKADHRGHRARMKKKFAEHGIDVFEQHEVLEILLYYAIPQRNTNDIAKNLIKRFGSFSAVLDAPLDALLSEGLTEHQALYLKMMPEVARLYTVDKNHNPRKVLNFCNVADYIRERFIGLDDKEHVFILLLDAKGKEVYSGMISDGGFYEADVPFRDIISLVLNYGAASVVLAHCHPSGIAIPSHEDLLVTLDLQEALQMLNVRLMDHYLVAGDKCISMKKEGLF